MDFIKEYSQNQFTIREKIAVFNGFLMAIDEYKVNPYKNYKYIKSALDGVRESLEEIKKLNDLNEELIKNI